MKSLTLLCLLSVAAPARAELPPLISRDLIFGNPQKTSPEISPDGTRLAYLAPDAKNVLQVWVRSRAKDDGRVVTADKRRGIRRFHWAHDGHTLLYVQDQDGDENFHVFAVDLDSQNVRDLTPFQGVRADVADLNPRFPQRLLVEMNLRDRQMMDVYSINLKTGAVELDTQNPGDVAGWNTDDNMVVRGAQVVTPEGGTEIRVRDGAKAPWRTLLKAPAEENVALLDFTKDGRAAYFMTSIGADTARVVRRDLKSGAETVLAVDPKVDASDILVQPTQHVVQAVMFAPGRARWQVVDPAVKDDFAALEKACDGDFRIVNRDDADKTWVVAYTRDRGSGRFYAYDRANKKAELLFAARPDLEGLTLAEVKPVTFSARDGLELNGYLTLPPGIPATNLPLVLDVHGGPWARDYWGFIPEAQWLANRGYAVLQVNFRGSTEYGKTFLHAGDKQWGQKMQDDLTDAVGWAVKQGYVDSKRVAIMGGSYGGYAALAGAVFTPDLYRCAVDIVGPSNLNTLLHSIPPYWKAMRSIFDTRVGNVDDAKDADLIRRESPLFAAERIRIPMLIGQGANDPRVKQAEAEQIVSAIEKNGKAVTYVIYPDEGHGFARPENRVDFYARAEAFLAENLGGRAEPLKGDRVAGATAVVKVVKPKVQAQR
jgi:dipeptidyl aminopeptidase/acylaminoacyl peptidase